MIEWRYREQLDWRLVLVGLSEDTSRYEAMGYTPARSAAGQVRFRDRYGMPFAAAPKPRASFSSRACRAVIAARLGAPAAPAGVDFAAFRALQLANFNDPSFLLDDDSDLRRVLAGVAGIDADAVVAAIDSDAVREAYAADKAETRRAAGSPTELQGKARNSDGLVRYTAPSVVFAAGDGRQLEAGGFQPVEAYDVLVVNLGPGLTRHGPPEDPGSLLEYFEGGLTTQEVAALMTAGNDPVDRAPAEQALVGLVGEGRAVRRPLGDDALWLAS